MALRAVCRGALVALLSLSASLGAITASGAHSPGGGGSGAPDVVVRAEPAPALWRVRKGASEIIILGSIAPTPLGAAWNTRVVAAALQGARVLMLSPGSTPGLAWADNFPDSQRYRLGQPFAHTLDRELDPAELVRLKGMAAEVGEPWSRYSHYRPGPAGMVLLEDSWRARGLTGSQLDDTVVGLAKAAHVRVVRVDEGGALPLIDAMPSMSDEQHAACIDQAMAQFERETAIADAGFRAWAKGDLAGLASAYRPVDLCVDVIPGGAQRRSRAQAIWLKALETALRTPGRTVALMDVSDLLEPSDLLDALKADGATVISPRDAPGWAPGPTPVLVRLPERLDAPDRASMLVGAAPALPGRLQSASAQDGRGAPGKPGSVCVSTTPAGTILPQTVCHTRAEWAAIERGKSPNQLRDFLRNNPGFRPGG